MISPIAQLWKVHDQQVRVLNPVLRGVLIGIWGAIIYLPTAGLFADPWIVWTNCIVWAIVYMRKSVTLALAGIQAATTVVAVVAGALLREPSSFALLAAFPALLYFALWMVPVGLIISFVKGGQSRKT